MYYITKVEGEGRICLPIALRRRLNWEKGTKIKVTEENNKIILETANKVCKLCGATEKLVPDIQICQSCVSAIKEIDLSTIEE